jgi:hypothetical protein
MKINNKLATIAAMGVLALLFTFASCEKTDTEDPGDSGSTTGNITDGAWVLTYSVGTTPAGTYDDFANMDACDKDDKYMFNKDGTWVVDEGGSKCDPADPQSTSGTYSIENNTELTIYDQNDTMKMTITTLTSSLLVLEYTDFDSVMMWEISGVSKYKH